MSARAAWRLETLGFDHVFRYAAGKVDWLAAGLPTEGTNATVARVGTVARRDVPTCRLSDRVGAVSDRVRASGWDQCVVVNERNIVLGRMTSKILEENAAATAEQVMEPGPVTNRPHELAHRTAHQLSERHAKSVLVTTADGELIGVFRAEDGLAPEPAQTTGQNARLPLA
jgi:predicted transcriptional regulator